MSPGTLKVTYLYHSGFAVETGGNLLLFDYWRDDGEGSLAEGRVDPESLSSYGEVVVFVSHAHGDHYNPAIGKFMHYNKNVHYVISSDLPPGAAGERLSPGMETEAGGARVKAFGSTDQGVSFYVEYAGFRIFHAGDLNWWHWRDQSTSREIDEAEKDFKNVVETLKGNRIDVAFFPVDPRQGSFYDAGAQYFALELKPAELVPMHFQERADAVSAFVRRARGSHVKIRELTVRGQSFEYRLPENAAEEGEPI